MTNYLIDINPRPFNAIKAGTKKIEIRVPTNWDPTPYHEVKAGDSITFTNNETQETLNVDVIGVRHYASARELLEAEGTRNTLSSGLPIDQAIERLNDETIFPEYKSNIVKYGVYGIELRVLNLK